MARGGPRPRSGRPVSAHSLARQYDAKSFTRLPNVCTTPIPEWPNYLPEPNMAEEEMWNELWQRPQAHIWHATHMIENVASYVRQTIEANKPKASSLTRTGARQLSELLCLSPGSLTKERYVIIDSPEDEILQGHIAAQDAATGTDGQGGARKPAQSSARSRMRVVPFTRDESGAEVENHAEENDPDA